MEQNSENIGTGSVGNNFMPASSNDVGRAEPPAHNGLGSFIPLPQESESSDSRSSLDSNFSSLNPTTTTGSELALRGSSSSPEVHIQSKFTTDYRGYKNNRFFPYNSRNRSSGYYSRRPNTYEVNRTLWVGNIPVWTPDSQLLRLFSKVGEIRHVFTPKKPTKKDVTKFAFIGYKNEESVPHALEQMQGVALFGRVLKLAPRHGSIHEAHASELEKKLEAMQSMESRKEELKRVRELAKLRMELTNASKSVDLDHLDETSNGYVKTTFHRNALEFERRLQQRQCQSLAREIYSKPASPRTVSIGDRNNGGHRDFRRSFNRSLSHTRTVRYKDHGAPHHTSTPLKIGNSRAFDSGISGHVNMTNNPGTSYYENGTVFVDKGQDRDNEDRKASKRKANLDLGRSHHDLSFNGRNSHQDRSMRSRKSSHDEWKEDKCKRRRISDEGSFGDGRDKLTTHKHKHHQKSRKHHKSHSSKRHESHHHRSRHSTPSTEEKSISDVNDSSEQQSMLERNLENSSGDLPEDEYGEHLMNSHSSNEPVPGTVSHPSSSSESICISSPLATALAATQIRPEEVRLLLHNIDTLKAAQLATLHQTNIPVPADNDTHMPDTSHSSSNQSAPTTITTTSTVADKKRHGFRRSKKTNEENTEEGTDKNTFCRLM